MFSSVSLRDAAWLCRREELRSNICVVPNTPVLEAAHPKPQDFPWFVELCLGRFSKKHIVRSSRPLSLHRIHRELENLEARLSWRWHFRNADRSAAPRPREKRAPLCYEGRIPGQLQVFIDKIKSVVWQEVRKANVRIKTFRSFYRLPSYVRRTLLWLQQNELEATPTDKDGVLAVVSKPLLNNLLKAELVTNKYQPIHDSNYQFLVRGDRKVFYSLAAKLVELGDRGWATESRRTLSDKKRRFRTNLSWTIKTHKPPGQLSVRTIHSGSGHSLSSLSGYVDQYYARLCKNIPHLCGSTKDVLDLMRGLRVPRGAVFVKIDIQDFYMRGAHDKIIKFCTSKIKCPKEKSFMEDLLFHLLFHQYVREPRTGELFQVVVGSGQGQRHSGSVSDFAFHELAEADLVEQSSISEFKVYRYVRYRDDIMYVADSWEAADKFLEHLARRAASCWELVLESASAFFVPMLDVCLFKERCGESSEICWKPWRKPTARHLPLHHSSEHLWSTHKAWPVGECRRFFGACKHCHFFEARRQEFTQHLQRHFFDPGVIQAVELWQPEIPSIFLQDQVVEQTCREVVWLVLPYSSALTSHLRRALGRVQLQSTGLWDKLACRLRIGLSSSSSGLNLAMLLRKAARGTACIDV